jgi:hypothetical protein
VTSARWRPRYRMARPHSNAQERERRRRQIERGYLLCTVLGASHKAANPPGVRGVPTRRGTLRILTVEPQAEARGLFGMPGDPETRSAPEILELAPGLRKWWERIKWVRRLVEWVRKRPEIPGGGAPPGGPGRV